MEKGESFGALLGEFLDRAVMAFDDLATATEQFIDKSVEGEFVPPHPADVERLNRIDQQSTESPEEVQKTPKRKSRSKSRSESKHEQENQEEPLQYQEEEPQPEILDQQTEEPAQEYHSHHNASVSESSQEGSQRRKKRRHHHQETNE